MGSEALRGPDPLVFGPQYEQDGVRYPVVHCRACGVTWSVYAGDVCWCCGKTATTKEGEA